MEKITARAWSDYEVIDSGKGKKLERFGSVFVIRPEGSARWKRALSPHEWDDLSHGEFFEEKSLKGHWLLKKEFPTLWEITYPIADKKIRFNLKQTRFKHVGIFPEQSVNWTTLAEGNYKKVLNLFAHTGGASQAAALGGAEVTHIDSVYSMVGWAKANGELAGVTGVKWICEEGSRFVQKEIERGKTYDLVILDPPSFGQSKKGKIWKIEKDLDPLMGKIKKLIQPGMGKRAEIILNCYSPRMDEKNLYPLLKKHFPPSCISLKKHVFLDNEGRELLCGLLATIKEDYRSHP